MLPLTAQALVQDSDLAAVLTGLQPQLAFVAIRYSVRAADRVELSRTHRTLALRPTPSLNALRPKVTNMGAAGAHTICGKRRTLHCKLCDRLTCANLQRVAFKMQGEHNVWKHTQSDSILCFLCMHRAFCRISLYLFNKCTIYTNNNICFLKHCYMFRCFLHHPQVVSYYLLTYLLTYSTEQRPS